MNCVSVRVRKEGCSLYSRCGGVGWCRKKSGSLSWNFSFDSETLKQRGLKRSDFTVSPAEDRYGKLFWPQCNCFPLRLLLCRSTFSSSGMGGDSLLLFMCQRAGLSSTAQSGHSVEEQRGGELFCPPLTFSLYQGLLTTLFSKVRTS